MSDIPVIPDMAFIDQWNATRPISQSYEFNQKSHVGYISDNGKIGKKIHVDIH